ncbi:hypothetical protein V7S43_015810 [Phytophthora oleae]|uniref:Uncharacterized protein n=1 Tax=Phytophthora oleae TaxID=2107226 RepID=A0ABD3EYA5_9STRA
MAGLNAYAQSLRSDRSTVKTYEEGIPFFVPQLSKVKTSVMCQGKNQKLLFKYETGSLYESPLSPKSLPYRKQGNHNLYTEDNLLKRQKLMEDPNVLKAIQRFWETFTCIRRGAETIPVHDYVDVFMKFYKALVTPSEFSVGEARFIVEKDWARDSIDGESMSKLLFFGSLFEVADIWTIDISAHEYASFLNKLFERVTMTIYDHVKLQWITAFAELDKIRSFDDPTPPDEDPANENLLDSSTKPGLRPPLVKTNPSWSSSDGQRLPEITSARSRGKTESESSNESWGSSLLDDLETDRYRLFEHSPPKTRLEQVLEEKQLKSDDEMQRLPRILPEISPQQVLLPIPSIYLNPDLTGVHEAERAARRRLRKNAKLVQRLRRITY